MPLSRYQIRNEYSLADPELYRAADKDDPEALLEGVAMAGLVGVLRQLGDLAEFAAEIFHDLHEEVMATAARGHTLMVRVQQLEAEFPLIEKAFLSQTNHSSFFYNPSLDWHPNLQMDQNVVTHGDLPRFVMDSYEECRGPPRLFLLDKFDVAGAGACLKRYTDPSVVRPEASSNGMTSIEFQSDKKTRKAKRKGSRWRNGETPEILPASHAKLHQLFLEERIENGITDPARRVKLKRRLNGFPFDSKSGKSYMEKFLKTLSPEHEVFQEIPVDSSPLQIPHNGNNDSTLDIIEISTVTPENELRLRKRTPSPSPCPSEESTTAELYANELVEVSMEMEISYMSKANGRNQVESVSSTLCKIVTKKEVEVDGECKSESCLDIYESDDIASEMETYIDALTTMESELDTDSELRAKSDILDHSHKKLGSQFDANDVTTQSHSSDCLSTRNSATSDDANSLSKKDMSSFSGSDTPSMSAESAHLDGECSVNVSSSIEIHERQLSETLMVNEDSMVEVLPDHGPEYGFGPSGGVVAQMDETLGQSTCSDPKTCPGLMILPPQLLSADSDLFSGKGELQGPETDELTRICTEHKTESSCSELGMDTVIPGSITISDPSEQVADDSLLRVSAGEELVNDVEHEDSTVKENVVCYSEQYSFPCSDKENLFTSMPAHNQLEGDIVNDHCLILGETSSLGTSLFVTSPYQRDGISSIVGGEDQLMVKSGEQRLYRGDVSLSLSNENFDDILTKDDSSTAACAINHYTDEVHEKNQTNFPDTSIHLSNALEAMPELESSKDSVHTMEEVGNDESDYSLDTKVNVVSEGGSPVSVSLRDDEESLGSRCAAAEILCESRRPHKDQDITSDLSCHIVDVTDVAPENNAGEGLHKLLSEAESGESVPAEASVNIKMDFPDSVASPRAELFPEPAWTELDDASLMSGAQVDICDDAISSDEEKSINGPPEPHISGVVGDPPHRDRIEVDNSHAGEENVDEVSSSVDPEKKDVPAVGSDPIEMDITNLVISSAYQSSSSLDILWNEKECEKAPVMDNVVNDHEVDGSDDANATLVIASDSDDGEVDDSCMDLKNLEKEMGCYSVPALDTNKVCLPDNTMREDENSLSVIPKSLPEGPLSTCAEAQSQLDTDNNVCVPCNDLQFGLLDSKELQAVSAPALGMNISGIGDFNYQKPDFPDNVSSDQESALEAENNLALDSASAVLPPLLGSHMSMDQKSFGKRNHHDQVEVPLSIYRHADILAQAQCSSNHNNDMLNEDEKKSESAAQANEMPHMKCIDQEKSADAYLTHFPKDCSGQPVSELLLPGNHVLSASVKPTDVPFTFISPVFSLFPEADPTTLEEMPPPPPLPPVQWRIGKVQQVSSAPNGEPVECKASPSLSSLPPINDQRMEHQNPVSQALASENEISPLAGEDSMQNPSDPDPFSLAVPAESQHGCDGFPVSRQRLNEEHPSPSFSGELPPVLHEERIIDDLAVPVGMSYMESSLPSAEPCQPTLNSSMKYSAASLESSEEKFEESLHYVANLQEKVEDGTPTSDGGLVTSDITKPHATPPPSMKSGLDQGELMKPLNEVPLVASSITNILEPAFANALTSSEAALQVTSVENNPAPRPSQAEPGPSGALGGKEASSEKHQNGITESGEDTLSHNASEQTAQNMQHQQLQHGEPISDGENVWPATDDGTINGSRPIKLLRPRSPLIDAVAAHDKSKLRKVTERVRPQLQKVDERDSILEQIRAKSFSLRPTVVTRPSIQGPQTNLKVAAILERAKTIRQAFAGSDEDDDDDSWSDS